WLLPYRLNVYWISVADTALLFALLAVGLGLVMGIAGQVNLAQIAFFGVGAYATGILTTHDGLGFWAAAAAALGCAILAGLVVVRTPLGRRMRAMRDDSLAAGAAGAEIGVLRMMAFLLAGVYGGAAGVLYAGQIHYIAPETFSIADMFLLLAMVIIGGRQSLAGCVTGAIGLTIVQQELVNLAAYAQLGYGLVVVLVVVFAPTGLIGIPARAARWFRRGRDGPAAVLEEFRPLPAASALSRDVLLEVSGLVKRFRGVTAVD